jgi:hypothetical protein
MDNPSKFWVETPCALFSDGHVFPLANMSRDEKLNAVTRLLAVATLALYLLDYENWAMFGLIGVVLIIILKYSSKTESFTLPVTYNSPDISQTTVAPMFSSEWHLPPPAYDLYTNEVDNSDDPMELMPPSSYPYGEYVTPLNMLLPSDEQDTRFNSAGKRSAREFANNTFMKRTIAYREEMSRLMKKKLQRRFRSNNSSIGDTFSPYFSS